MLKSSSAHKVIGYFSYSEIGVFCDDDACVISGTKKSMLTYINQMLPHHHNEGNIIKKTRFDEIIGGLERGGAYAFDKEAYIQFFSLAQKHGISDLPTPRQFFSEKSPTGLHFIRIQFG
jgi:hypothetical protein